MGHQYFLNNQFNMYKFALLLTLVLIGASGKNLSRNGDDWVPSEEDLQKIIDLVLCSCDDGDYDHQLSIEEYTSPVCEAIGFHLFDHENSADDFDYIDTNQDGVATFDEIFSSAMEAVHGPRKFTPALRDFTTEHAVQAAVHVLGCACDNDMSFTVDSEEANADECQAVQEWAFGEAFLGEYFADIDQDSNGEIDGQEATDAINYIIENDLIDTIPK